MALVEAWAVKVDIAADDTVEVAPANEEAKHNTSLVDAFDVVGDPGNGEGDAGVDAESAQKGADVLHGGLGGGHHHDETDDANNGADNVEDATLLDTVGPEADDDGHDGGQDVGRHAEELVLDNVRLLGDAHVLDNGGEEETKSVERHEGAHVDEHGDVRLPVLDGSPEGIHLEALVGGRGLLVLTEAEEDASAVLGGEKLGLGGEVVDEPKGHDGDDDGDGALDDEDPRPAGAVGEAVHVLDGGGEQAAKGAGDGGSGEEDGGAHAKLAALVPAGQVVVDAGEETSLGHAQEPTGGHQLGPVVDEAHADHGGTPKDPVERACQRT